MPRLKKYFPLLALPRELRDKILDHAIRQPFEIASPLHMPPTTLRNISAQPRLLLHSTYPVRRKPRARDEGFESSVGRRGRGKCSGECDTSFLSRRLRPHLACVRVLLYDLRLTALLVDEYCILHRVYRKLELLFINRVVLKLVGVPRTPWQPAWASLFAIHCSSCIRQGVAGGFASKRLRYHCLDSLTSDDEIAFRVALSNTRMELQVLQRLHPWAPGGSNKGTS